MGPSFAENFKKSPPSPLSKKPLKPPLLLFELFVQSEPRAMLMGPRGCMVGLAAMLPPGIERTSKPSAPMSAIEDKADMVWTSQNVRS
jgi:hypothetical protein